VSEISQRYSRLADAFTEKIRAVPDGAWEKPTPCELWTARDLVRHVVASQGMFLGFVGSEAPATPSVDDDPLGAWTATSSVVRTVLEDPGLASTEFEGMLGRSTFESAVDRFLCMDLVVHGWDLARAIGLDEHIEVQELSRVRAQAEQLGDALRNPQAFGPALETPAGADEQAKLLAFLGRTA
jgi:uncharacterized protein (TIGR03086 family)